MGSFRAIRSGRSRRGQALVEFVLVFPLFLMVLFSIIRVAPRTDPATLTWPAPATIGPISPGKADGDDKASDIAAAPGPGAVQYDTTVTVYACFNWRPPMAGFVIIPNTISIRAAAT